MLALIYKFKITLILVLFLMTSHIVVGYLNSLFAGDYIYNMLACHSDTIMKPLSYYTFITYWMVHSSHTEFIRNCSFIFVVSLILEPKLPKIFYMLVILLSEALGGIIFCTFTTFTSNSPSMLLGSTPLYQGLAGCLMGVYLIKKPEFYIIEKLYVLFTFISIICFIGYFIANLQLLWIYSQLTTIIMLAFTLYSPSRWRSGPIARTTMRQAGWK
jgi:membrane associated rhomboid family serine protease